MPLLNKGLLQDTVAKHKHEFSSSIKQDLQILFKDTLNRIETGKFKKEESEKVSFLQRLFELLGYKLHTNLEFEYSTQGRSIDAVLGLQSEKSRDVEVAIEWKGIDTKKLDGGKAGETAVSQMWDYMGKVGAEIGIVGNFLEFRIYTLKTKQTQYQEYLLRDLATKDHCLDEFIFVLKKQTLLRNNGKQSLLENLISQSELEQEKITKRFYNDYKQIRLNLYEHLVQNNPVEATTVSPFGSMEVSATNHKILLLEKSQKILDRLIFVMFCEDGLLLPTKTSIQVFENAKNSFGGETKIWQQFQGLFGAIDKGSLSPKINAFNGGLFATDETLNNLIIKNEIWLDLIKLAQYDFASDLNVNILGHIFEQSIADIEQIKNQIEGNDQKKSKRKKDGIYYTPEYITDYIVTETIENWLKDQTPKIANFDPLKWVSPLQSIKVLDPAGGSGAFPNQVHNFLVKKHVEQVRAKAQKDGFDPNLTQIDEKTIDKSILQNNIFMVDLQPESVEIAKLSLWLKTAKKDQKLNNLDQNIKCGNSLINDPILAGDRAFDWNAQFPQVMTSGGFDVIVGNPPYGAELSVNEQEYLLKKYNFGTTETVILFILKSLDLLSDRGFVSFIIPKSFCFASNYAKIRKLVWDNVVEIIDCGKVWHEVQLEQIIVTIQKGVKHNFYINKTRNGEKLENKIKIDKYIAKEFNFFLNGISQEDIQKAQKIRQNSVMLNDIAENRRGAMLQKFISDKGDLDVIGGADISRNGIVGIKGQINKVDINDEKAYIKQNSILVQRIIAHIENPKPHIKITACIPTSTDYILVDTINQISLKDGYLTKFVYAVLNSEICNWYVYNFVLGKAIRTMQFDNPTTSQLPIPKATAEEQGQIAELVDKIMDLKKSSQKLSDSFVKLVTAKYLRNTTNSDTVVVSTTKVSIKLKKWYKLEVADFLTELKKQKAIIGGLSAEAELVEYFEQQQAKVLELETQIQKVDAQIESLVRRLYGIN